MLVISECVCVCELFRGTLSANILLVRMFPLITFTCVAVRVPVGSSQDAGGRRPRAICHGRRELQMLSSAIHNIWLIYCPTISIENTLSCGGPQDL